MHVRTTLRRSLRAGARQGMTLIEVAVSIAILAVVFLATASAFSSTMQSTERARRSTEAAVFLESTLENVAAQPYNNLLSFDGNRVFDGAGAGDSNYQVDLRAFLAAVDLVQVDATLTDLRTGEVVARTTSLRSRR